MNSPLFCAFVLVAASVCSSLAQDHGHLNVGAQGDALRFDNGGAFNSPYVKTLLLTNVGKYSNVYSGNITLTALHSTNAFGEIDPVAPRAGSFIVAEIVSVQGPVGGAFQFWETNSTTAASVNLPAGTTNASFRFELSEGELGAGQPGGDPFGHIHGRRFSATLPGLYSVGFRAYDTSSNGADGGPIHTPSPVQLVNFQAGVVLTKVEPDEDHSHITLGAMANFSWQLQTAVSLTDPNWKDVSDPILGNDLLQEIEDDHAVAGNRFYRVVGTEIPP